MEDDGDGDVASMVLTWVEIFWSSDMAASWWVLMRWVFLGVDDLKGEDKMAFSTRNMVMNG